MPKAGFACREVPKAIALNGDLVNAANLFLEGRLRQGNAGIGAGHRVRIVAKLRTLETRPRPGWNTGNRFSVDQSADIVFLRRIRSRSDRELYIKLPAERERPECRIAETDAKLLVGKFHGGRIEDVDILGVREARGAEQSQASEPAPAKKPDPCKS